MARRFGLRRAGILSVVVIGGLVFSGCTTPHGDAAVYPGGSVSMNELDATVNDLNELTASAGSQSSGETLPASQILPILMYSDILDQLFTKKGEKITDQEVRRFTLEFYQRQGLKIDKSLVTDNVVNVWRGTYIRSKLENSSNAAEIFATATGRMTGRGVSVNPRFGKIDPSTSSVSPVSYPWLKGVKPIPSGADQ